MATLNALTLDVEDMLYGLPQIERPAEDTLSTAVTTAADTSWVWTTTTLWKRGDYAEYMPTSGAVGEIVLATVDDGTTVRRAQQRTTAASPTVLGTATYDETGGAAEDLWTVSAVHGLSVGGQAVFTIAGTGATGYVVNTGYYVAAVPSTTTLTLSATSGGAAIAGTGDGTGWTIATPAYNSGLVFRKNPVFSRVKIQRYINEIVDSLFPDVWIRTSRSIDINPGRYYYPLNSSDYKVESVHQADISVTAIGDCTFDVTGGASEDLWTLTAHGLAVGDAVRFTAAGTGADGYAGNTVYWVATAPSSSTFQLSATESTTVLEGTGSDSSGTWTLERIDTFAFAPLPPDAWEVVTGVDSRTSNTNRILRLMSYYSDSDTLYYQAKTKPSSSSYSDIPDIMADFIPYGAAWLLLGGTRVVPPRIDSLRSLPEKMPASQAMADSRFFRDEFERRKAEYRRQLEADMFPKSYLRRNEVVVR